MGFVHCIRLLALAEVALLSRVQDSRPTNEEVNDSHLIGKLNSNLWYQKEQDYEIGIESVDIAAAEPCDCPTWVRLS